LPVGHGAEIGDLGHSGQAVVGQQPLQPFTRAIGPRGQNDLAIARQCANMIGQGTEKIDLLLLALRREAAPGPCACIQNTGAGALGQGRKLHHAVRRHRGFPGGIVKIKLPRRHGLVDRVEPPLGRHRLGPGVIAVGDPLPTRQARGGDLVVQHHRRLGQVVEQRFQPGVEEGQPMLHALMLAARADGLIKRVIGARRAKADAIVLPEAGNRGLVQDDLRNGGKLYPLQLFHRALGFGVKPPRAVQHVAEEIQPDRPTGTGRVDVHDPAAQCIIPGLGDRGHRRKAHPRQKPLQPRLIHPFTHDGAERGRPHHLARGNALGGGVQRGQQHEGAGQSVRQKRKRRHPPGGQVGVRTDTVVRQAVPGRELQHRDIRRQHRQRRAHRLGPLVVAGDMQDWPPPRQFARQKQGVKALGRAAKNDAFRRHGMSGSVQDGKVEVHPGPIHGGDENRHHPDAPGSRAGER
jgi:hypothetical protein